MTKHHAGKRFEPQLARVTMHGSRHLRHMASRSTSQLPEIYAHKGETVTKAIL